MGSEANSRSKDSSTTPTRSQVCSSNLQRAKPTEIVELGQYNTVIVEERNEPQSKTLFASPAQSESVQKAPQRWNS